MVEDVIATATANLARLKPESADEVRSAGETIVAFSAGMAAGEKELKAFLYKNMYRADEVMRVRAEAERVVLELFDAYFANPRKMPEGWREGLDRAERPHQGARRRGFPGRNDRHLRAQGAPAAV